MALVNEIIEGISTQLRKEFGEECRICDEMAVQEAQGPCFCIIALNSSRKPGVGQQYDCRNSFEIRYFPEEIGKTGSAMNEVAERLFQAVSSIMVCGDSIRGTELHWEKSGGIIHFFVDYNRMVLRQKDFVYMGELNVQITGKE